MYFWKTHRLAEDLKNNHVDENEFYQYILTSSIIFALILEYTSYSEPNLVTQLSLWKSGCVLLFTIIGTYHCYRVNSEGDNQRFVERIASLNVPLFIKITFLGIFSGIVIGVFSQMFFLSEVQLENTVQVTEVLLTLIFYWRLYVHIKFIAH